ncbi:hypothetical protein MCOR27_005618 [Pyricularia oryzae]|uniref:Uncharacterized protein n=1 Tax=Pyricularia grisea TaxID=148305 RepID=A0ABQ8N8E8_PYRGI|nr:hypothetical protein MCOR27_005618 [Pyricularia oryzae]KAI6292158.1 hypothetical protein MCOR33_010051 [Pyricularia grisea]KAI6318441.1 hypothetical protein MCOR34_003584 [Pyricularia oryzae]KAI6467083.1 hypothetical protein MCOR17_004605 [Pyricularia oryzae]KAI6605294.1 hypothetical protein MCOR12_001886 [Pyricularia oryzae]
MPRNSFDATKSNKEPGALRRFGSRFSLRPEESQPNEKPESKRLRFAKMLGTVFPTSRRRSTASITESTRTQSIPAQSSPRTARFRPATAPPIRREQIRIIRDPLPTRPARPFCPATSHIIVSLQRGSSSVQPPHVRPEAGDREEGSIVLYRPPPNLNQQPTHRQKPEETHTHQWATGSPRPLTRDTETPASTNRRNGSDHARPPPPPEHRQETALGARSPHATARRSRAPTSPTTVSIIAGFPEPPCCPPPPEWIRDQAAAGNPAWMSSMSDSGPSRRSLLWKRLKRWGKRVRVRLDSSRSRRASKLWGKGQARDAEEPSKRPMSEPPPQLPRRCSSVYSTGSGMCVTESEGWASASGARLSWPGSSRPPVGGYI